MKLLSDDDDYDDDDTATGKLKIISRFSYRRCFLKICKIDIFSYDITMYNIKILKYTISNSENDKYVTGLSRNQRRPY